MSASACVRARGTYFECADSAEEKAVEQAKKRKNDINPWSNYSAKILMI